MNDLLKKNFILTTVDDIAISVDLYRKNGSASETLFVIAPGFSQHKSTRPISEMAKSLSQFQDTLVLDFRGNGKSGGRFTFGASEYLDLHAVLTWAKPRYGRIVLLGLSLGAYHSLRIAAVLPDVITQLLLVSCPTRVEEIVTSGGALLHPLCIMMRNVHWRIQPQFDVFFRWSWPFTSKPDARELAKSLTVPAAFLVAGKDTLIFERYSRYVYNAYNGHKTWTCFPEGLHAESMFLQNPDSFVAWVRRNSMAAFL